MRSIITTTAAAGLALFATTSGASAQCGQGFVCVTNPVPEVQTVTVGPAQLSVLQDDVFFTRFNTMGGTRQLTSVEIDVELSIAFDLQLENLLIGVAQFVSASVGGGVLVVDPLDVSNPMGFHVIDLDPGNPGNQFVFQIAPAPFGQNLAGYDGTTDGMGVSGFSTADTVSDSNAQVLTNPMDLARFIQGSGSGPNGPVQFSVATSNAGLQCNSSADVFCQLLTMAEVTVTVRYFFCECMPEMDNGPCVCLNRRQPGSLLLFPEYDHGPGRVTVYTVTNANCLFTSGNVDVEFRYINGDTCLEANQKETLTPCDTITFLTSAHTGFDKGYAYAYARDSSNTTAANPAGTPIVFNHLVGQQLVIDGWKSFEYSVNAVSFKGIGEERASTDKESPGPFAGVTGDGIRDLDGFEYEEAPDRILIPRFLGQDPVLNPRGLHSDLILIALSGGRQFRPSPLNPAGGTTILINGWNDNEQMFSLEHTFACWQKLRLGLLQSGDLETPVPGTMVFDNTTLSGFGNDPDEIAGAMGLESGWFWIDGVTASSTAETILDPAVYAVLVETIRSRSAGDLPFEYCTQKNGDLLPGNLLGDFNREATPPFNNMDNQ